MSEGGKDQLLPNELNAAAESFDQLVEEVSLSDVNMSVLIKSIQDRIEKEK